MVTCILLGLRSLSVVALTLLRLFAHVKMNLPNHVSSESSMISVYFCVKSLSPNTEIPLFLPFLRISYFLEILM